jgi:hypothetical protein
MKTWKQNNFFGFLAILVLTFAITACDEKNDTNGKDDTIDTIDAMWLVPQRFLYQLDEKFLRNEDFYIFIGKNGRIIEIPPTDPGVTVEISGIGLSNVFHDPVPGAYYTFHIVGRHTVTVTYASKTARYSLEVFSPDNGDSNGIIFSDDD